MRFGYRTTHMMDNPASGTARVPIVYVKPNIKWEYRVMAHTPGNVDTPDNIEETLNTLGAEGWELVSVVPREGGADFYLKRLAE
ncbi:MAG: DUF4177 domain-containing protein [Chloroflexota bacterium]